MKKLLLELDFIQEQLKDYYENHKADLELVLDK